MKKLINNPGDVVAEMVEGLVAVYPGLARLADTNVVLRVDIADVQEQQVAVISGGGSGHEPAHAGYVGAGMLSAAVVGDVFTSPSSDSVYSAIKAVCGPPGVLLIVKNYTGDRLNFGIAAELARAEGICVETVLVADDIELAATQDRSARRGIAGTVLVHKVAGAAAAEGRSLSQVAEVAREAAAALATMGVSLSAGTVPASGQPGFVLGEAEVELGLGIHGEPGIERALLQSADAMTVRLLDSIFSARPLRAGAQVALMINNLGATTNMELAIVGRRALNFLQARQVVVQRVYMGTFMSSLEMAGVSLSLFHLNDERLRLLDAWTAAPAWPSAAKATPLPIEERTFASSARSAPQFSEDGANDVANGLVRAIKAACTSLIGAREQLTKLDQTIGDGDLGFTLARGAATVLEELPHYPLSSPAETLSAVGRTLQRVLGGTSGPLYGVFFLRAAQSLKTKQTNDALAWAEAAREAVYAISEIGGASPGDRTMLDALVPFAETLQAKLRAGEAPKDAMQSAVLAAEKGAEMTAHIEARRGRSSYLGDRILGYPDPGAIAVATWLRAVAPYI